jgi:oligoribonuclease (3'-5' exoribonuclease)
MVSHGIIKDNIILGGMPELLFRARFAHQVTNASILADFQSLYTLIEEEEYFLENKKKNELDKNNYIHNSLLSDQDFILKSSLHFNSSFYRSGYTLSLIKELANEYDDLILISDPLTTFHLRDILKKEKAEKELRFREREMMKNEE